MSGIFSRPSPSFSRILLALSYRPYTFFSLSSLFPPNTHSHSLFSISLPCPRLFGRAEKEDERAAYKFSGKMRWTLSFYCLLVSAVFINPSIWPCSGEVSSRDVNHYDNLDLFYRHMPIC